MAAISTVATTFVDRQFDLECAVTQGVFACGGVSPVPIIFPVCIAAPYRNGYSFRKMSFTKVGPVSVRARKKSPDQKLNTVVSHEFYGTSQIDVYTGDTIENPYDEVKEDEANIELDTGFGAQMQTTKLDAQLGKDLRENVLAHQLLPTSEQVAVREEHTFLEPAGSTDDFAHALSCNQNEIELALEDENSQLAATLEDQIVLDEVREKLQKDDLLELAEKHSYMGSKIFFSPVTVVAGCTVEIFLDRNITTLVNCPKILMKGFFNDWRWKPFLVELSKSDLPGDWWYCKLDVVPEAYKIDFIFFDGENVFENNETNNFFMLVNGGMTKYEFEYLLFEEEMKAKRCMAEEKTKMMRRAAEERELSEKRLAEEADRAKAKKLVSEIRESSSEVLQKAVHRVDGLWYIEPAQFQGGDTVTLFYNKAFRALSLSKEVWIHGGFNNWKDMVSTIKKLSFQQSEGGEWGSVEVVVPEKAYTLNWVFADGPPERAQIYDNNGWQDFHALVANILPEDKYWAEAELEEYMKLCKERLRKEDANHEKAKHIALLKAELKARTKASFLRSKAHIFFTEPVNVQAGGEVTVFYNPESTCLNGKPNVWMRGSFNRWMHRNGCFPPKLMVSANGTHLKATVQVPRDAYILDLVFSEEGDDDGGVYDNRNGLDYHVPVIDSVWTEPPLHVVHICVEMAPIAKVGGLGDVVTSLSRAMQELGHIAEVVLPKYDCLKYEHIWDLEEKEPFDFGGTRIRVWNGEVEGLLVHFLEPENGMFWAGCIYGRRDDGSRFHFFSHAALQYLVQTGQQPDIIHCHDWSSAPVAWLFKEGFSSVLKARIVFTIHNLEFGAPLVGKAVANAHMATTVSETYAQEVSGHPGIAPHLSKFHGIRNGIDPTIWDPYSDAFIPMAYTSNNFVKGKRAAKQELQRRLGLQQECRPLVGIITRLTAQKGIHLIKHGIWRTLERGGQVVLLGSAPDPRVQNDFIGLANQLSTSHGDMARLCLSYDEPLSHLIYAGADFFLIPSIFEPCGLTQLTAMRYGAIPVVRKTGGLNDTVFDVDHDEDRAKYCGLETNGYSFEGTDAAGIDYALNRAITTWYEAPHRFSQLCGQVMQQDWSWNRPALEYIELYYGAKKKAE